MANILISTTIIKPTLQNAKLTKSKIGKQYAKMVNIY